MAHPVMQFQMISKAPDKTASFYSSLFGWTIDAANPLGYRRVDTGSKEGIQGGIWPAPPQAADFVQLFIAVDEVESAVRRAEDLGAKVIVPPSMLPEGDEMAVLQDPQGMTFAVWRRAAP
jgi:predicted enzyme related to lactoylglutathione lyase